MSTFLTSVKGYLTKQPRQSIVEREELFPIVQYILELSQSVAILNNPTAITDPTTSDDSSAGYSIGSYWFNTSAGTLWIAQSVGVGAASWLPVLGTPSTGQRITVSSGDFVGNDYTNAALSGLTPDDDFWVYAGGLLMQTGADYTLSGDTITVPSGPTDMRIEIF